MSNINSRNLKSYICKQDGEQSTYSYTELAHTSSNLKEVLNFSEDATISSLRESKEQILLSKSASCDIETNFRLTNQAKKLRAGALRSKDEQVITQTADINWTDKDTEVSGNFTGVKMGDFLLMIKSSDKYVFQALTDGTATGIYLNGDYQEPVNLMKSYITKVNRSDDKAHEFSVQERETFNTSKYKTMYDAQVSTWTLNTASDSFITESFQLMGKRVEYSDTKPAQGSDSPKEVVRALASTMSVQGVYINGDKANCLVQDFEITLDNTTEENRALGESNPCGFGFGDPKISGSMTVYNQYPNPFEYEKIARANGNVLFGIVIEDSSTGKMMSISGIAQIINADLDKGATKLITSLELSFLKGITICYLEATE